MNESAHIPGINDIQDERACIREIKKGSKEAFEALYRFYYPRLCQFAFRYVPAKQVAEDLVHNVFYKVWMNRENLKPQGAIKSYLYTAVRNQALNHLEKGKIRQQADDEAIIQLESTATGPSEELSNKELKKAITEALEQIPERRRHIFLMHREDELTYREIAEMLDISVKTVETQMSRSLKFLREKLAEFR
jgi:RNA polymerase sigma-70 factor (ECF subfamily)